MRLYAGLPVDRRALGRLRLPAGAPSTSFPSKRSFAETPPQPHFPAVTAHLLPPPAGQAGCPVLRRRAAGAPGAASRGPAKDFVSPAKGGRAGVGGERPGRAPSPSPLSTPGEGPRFGSLNSPRPRRPSQLRCRRPPLPSSPAPRGLDPPRARPRATMPAAFAAARGGLLGCSPSAPARRPQRGSAEFSVGEAHQAAAVSAGPAYGGHRRGARGGGGRALAERSGPAAGRGRGLPAHRSRGRAWTLPPQSARAAAESCVARRGGRPAHARGPAQAAAAPDATSDATSAARAGSPSRAPPGASPARAFPPLLPGRSGRAGGHSGLGT